MGFLCFPNKLCLWIIILKMPFLIARELVLVHEQDRGSNFGNQYHLTSNDNIRAGCGAKI